MKKGKYLVTGCAGFIGSNLVKKLYKDIFPRKALSHFLLAFTKLKQNKLHLPTFANFLSE